MKWLISVLALINFTAFAGQNPEIAECKSKDVWDTGFELTFDLGHFVPQPGGAVQGKIYRVIPLWQLELVFEGALYLVPSSIPGNCQFKLVDNISEPAVEIEFRQCGEPQSIEILQLKGAKPTEFAELACEETLYQSLSKGAEF